MKVRILAVLSLCLFVIVPCVSGAGATLNVRVLDSNGNPAIADIAVFAFPTSGGTGEPDPYRTTLSTMQIPTGTTFYIEEGFDYMIFATTQNFSPTIRQQMMDPSFIDKFSPVRYKDGSIIELATNKIIPAGGTIERYIKNDLSGKVGQIRVDISNIPAASTPSIVIADIRTKSTDEPVAFGASMAVSTISAALYIYNVQPAEAGKYKIFIGMPQKPSGMMGYEFDLSTPVRAGVTTLCGSDASGWIAPETTEQSTTQEGNVSIYGVVVSTEGAGIENCRVSLHRHDPSKNPSDWSDAWSAYEGNTDYNGRFTFYDVLKDSYAVNISVQGYKGMFDTKKDKTATDGQGYWYNPDTIDITLNTKMVIRAGGYLPDGVYKFAKVLGTIKGRIYQGNISTPTAPVLVPEAEVFVWSDWTNWPPIGGDLYDNYFTTGTNRGGTSNGRARVDSNGYFEIKGVGEGNYGIQVWSPLLTSGFSYNTAGTTYYYYRVTVTSYNPVDGAVDWKTTVFEPSGKMRVEPNQIIDIYISTPSPAGMTQISGTITFDWPAGLVISANNPVTIWAWEDKQGDSQTPRKAGFTQLPIETLNSTTKTLSYVINVPTGTAYWLDVKSQNWANINQMDMKIDFTQNPAPVTRDFKLVPGGIIRGVVRLPDGSVFKPNFDSNKGTQKSMGLIARGMDSMYERWGQIPEDGVFEILGVAPGMYKLKTRGREQYEIVDGTTTTWSERVLPWPDTEILDVMVSADPPGKITYVEIQLQNGVLTQPVIPELPALPDDNPAVFYGIGTFPSGSKMDGKNLSKLLFDEPLYSFDINYDTNEKKWKCNSARIIPGRYDFFLVYGMQFEPEPPIGGSGQPACDKQLFLFITGLKNKQIVMDSDPLKKDATTYVELGTGPLGNCKLTGKVTGKNAFLEKDMAVLANDFKKILQYIPSVLVYDSQGTMKAFSMAMPPNSVESIQSLMLACASGDINKIREWMANYPLKYYFERLPAGNYTLGVQTLNYPPLMKQIELVSGETVLDIDFDILVGEGLKIEGVVKSTYGVVLANATIKLQHRNVEKMVTSDSNGKYSVTGLPQGTYRITVRKSGYSLAGKKVSLGTSDLTGINGINFELAVAEGSFSGTVFSQRIPTPKTMAGLTVVAYDDTYNALNPSAYLPVYKAITDKKGSYFIPDLVKGHNYKLFVLPPKESDKDYRLVFATVTATNSNTTIDFVLIPAPPKMKVSMRLIYDGGWKYRFLIKSPKKLVTAPDCWYSPGQQFDSLKASQIPTIAGPNNSYGFDLSTLEDHEYYTLQVKIVTVDGKEDKEAIVFGPKIKALAKKDVKDELAEGGAFEIDETGDDVTQILLDAGTLEPKTDGTAVTGISVSGVGASAVGGFVTALPNFKLNKTSEEDTTLIDSLISNMVCSDIYEVNLKDAQINKSITLTMNYDSKKIKESDLKNLQICQYNSDKKKWETLSGTKTIDPITGTVSIEIESIAEAYKSTTTRLSSMAGRSMNTGSGFTINPMQATSQTGTFAIFSSTLPTKVGYAGSDFKIINFPNPFDLKSKNVSMTESGVGAGTVNQSLTGTMLKFYVPAGAGSADVKFYIYNIAGELVRKIESAKTIDGVDMSNIERGYIYYIEWDGKNDSKEECASGVYLLIPKVDNKKATERALKMAIIK